MTKADSSKPPAKLQTIILKVYIHCEGCRRKVRRIIRVLDGVETVTVDSSTSKVTVTGTVDAKAILERLQKHKKHAEMWPSSNPAGNSSSGKADGNQQPGKPKTTTDGAENNKKKNNGQAADAGGDKPAAGGAASAEGKKGDASAEGKKGAAKEVDEVAKGEGGALKSNTPEGAKEATGTNKGGSAETNGSSGGGGGGGSGGGGGGGKKGGKKGGNGGGNISNGGGGGETAVTGPVNTEPTTTSSTANSTDVVVSANKSHAPMTNDSVQTEYAYHSAEYATHMFSDENANNCSIM